jgi:N-methylhydantoinase A
MPEAQGRVAVAAAPRPAGRRAVFDGRSGRSIDVPVYRREALPPGSAFAGPAVVAEDETSTYITASFTAHIDASGSIVMDRKDA